ncbi:MAG: type II toxin-antitoxin system RelE/ParE family toxin [Terricaulis sp.]
MTLPLRWAIAAQRDLIDIWIWRGRERPELGDRALDRIEAACARLSRFPYLGPPIPRIAPEARKLSVEGYLVLYRVESDAVVLVRVVDQRQLLEALKFEDD